MTTAEKRALVQRLAAGRRAARARRPQRIAELERQMQALGDDYRDARARLDYRSMARVREEIARVNRERMRLID